MATQTQYNATPGGTGDYGDWGYSSLFSHATPSPPPPSNLFSYGGGTQSSGGTLKPQYGAPSVDANGNPVNANGGAISANMTAPNNMSGTAPMGANGIPDYWGIAQQQSQTNLNLAKQQSDMNNPNIYGPGGSQVRTQNPDGTYSLTQSLSPELQRNYDASNQLQGSLLGRAQGLAGSQGLNFDSAGTRPTFDTSGVSGMPQSDANDLAQTRDSLYSQQTQYLDPQFKQAESDLQSRLANQGIMPGSEAYDREVNNLGLAKQKAYGDARNSAIQAGGAEQSRLFGLGLQSHTTGMNDALAGFNTGMQGRQQGVSEATALHNSPINDISALRTGSQVTLPTYGGTIGTSIPGVDYMNAANMGFNAQLGLSNADAAAQNNTRSGLFGLGAAAIQSPWVGDTIKGLFG